MRFPDRAYLSIIRWPDGADEAWCAQTLAAAADMDEFQARQIFRRGVPQVLMGMSFEQATDALRVLRQAGVTAMAPGRGAMQALSGFVQAKRLIEGGSVGDPMIAAEPWGGRGDGVAFRANDIFLLVRATLRTTVSKTVLDLDSPTSTTMTTMLGPDVAIAHAAMEGGAVAVGAGSRTKQTTLTEILDIHLSTGARVRINGDKFNFDVLGPGRRYSDRESTDKLALWLAAKAPRAIVDTSFDKFRCPTEITREHFQSFANTTIRRTTDHPAFEFYSTWVCLMYRSRLGG